MEYTYLLLTWIILFDASCEADFPDGYLGCFHKDTVQLNLNDSENNSGAECNARCHNEEYKYAGTKKKKQCYCFACFGHFESTIDGCDKECDGNRSEVCGGKDYFSVYDTFANTGGYLGCFHENTVQIKLNNPKNNRAAECKLSCADENYRYAGTKNKKQCYCFACLGDFQSTDDACDKPCTGDDSEMCGGNEYFSVYDTWASTSMSTLTTEQYNASGIPKSSSTASGSLTNGKTLGDSDMVIASAVSVPLVTVIGAVAVIVFMLLRRRRLKSPTATESYPGTSITNKNYEDGHGLVRHDSLLNACTDNSADSGYTEISVGNSHKEETLGDVYHTIDILPEDLVTSNYGYEHLKVKSKNGVGENYSHCVVNQTGQVDDTTYTNSGFLENEEKGNKLNKQDDGDNTYNKLQTSPRAYGKHLLQKQEGRNDGAESEYNHATAGLPEPATENNADTYSHLNKWKTQQATTNAEIITPDHTRGLEKESECKITHKVGPDGYEIAVGTTANNYFILEPENKPSGNEVGFRIVGENVNEQTFENERSETPNHQYFILEKNET